MSPAPDATLLSGSCWADQNNCRLPLQQIDTNAFCPEALLAKMPIQEHAGYVAYMAGHDSEEDTLINNTVLLNSACEVGAALLLNPSTAPPSPSSGPVFMDTQEFSYALERMVATKMSAPTISSSMDDGMGEEHGYPSMADPATWQASTTASSRPVLLAPRVTDYPRATTGNKRKHAALKKALSIQLYAASDEQYTAAPSPSPSPSSNTDLMVLSSDSSQSFATADWLAQVGLTSTLAEQQECQEVKPLRVARTCVTRRPRMLAANAGAQLPPMPTATPSPPPPAGLPTAPSLPHLSMRALPTMTMATTRAASACSEGVVKSAAASALLNSAMTAAMPLGLPPIFTIKEEVLNASRRAPVPSVVYVPATPGAVVQPVAGFECQQQAVGAHLVLGQPQQQHLDVCAAALVHPVAARRRRGLPTTKGDTMGLPRCAKAGASAVTASPAKRLRRGM